MIILLLLILMVLPAKGASNNADKVLSLKKTTAHINIDGIIDSTWNEADSVTDFFQLAPYYAEAVTNKTVAKVLTTEEAIYCLMVCYDDKKNIQQSTGMLDDGGGDIVSFMIDTFNDKKTAYKFAVNAAGVKADCRLLDDSRNRDYSWDGIWFAASKVYDWGFVIEMEIPYKSIQYENNLTYWGLDFDRWLPAKTEDTYWCQYERNEGQRISKFGKLKFEDFNPTVKGLNLEIYPVGISKGEWLHDNKYKMKYDAGLDILYNPSQALKFQFTANPDFAQIEADPFSFNISRYETYFNERRPFFTEGNEIFQASGKMQNTGFYSPLELFYSRRIGKFLPDGSTVPLQIGTKAFGRLNDIEYGGFLAETGEANYVNGDGRDTVEERAIFHSVRLKKTIFDNSSIGVLFVGKQTRDNYSGVLDVDGALRQPEWQLSYQLARSINNNNGDYAASAGLVGFSKTWMNYIKGRYVGKNFNIEQVGYVPWIGTANVTFIEGPNWYFDKGWIQQIIFWAGGSFNYKNVEQYTDRYLLLGYNMQFRDNWGMEIDFDGGKAQDNGIRYDAYDISFSSWYNISPLWSGNLYGGYSKTYNFQRDYYAPYGYAGFSGSYLVNNFLQLGTSYDMYIEGKPGGKLEDITWNTRPFIQITPVNDLRIRTYFDNVYVKSSQHFERFILGFLFSYNFSPKSWIYFAYNDIQDRSEEQDIYGNILPVRMHTVSQNGVLKVKYLYYF